MWSRQLRRSISNALKNKKTAIRDDRVKGQLSHYEARMSRDKENIIFIYWFNSVLLQGPIVGSMIYCVTVKQKNNNNKNKLTLLKGD